MAGLDPNALTESGTNLVAFSGGPDSVCLLHQLATSPWRERVQAVHIDHALDAGSAGRAERAVAIARSFGVDCRVRRLDPDRFGHGRGPEAAARQARYDCLAQMIEPGDHVLTAHHADDQVETLLLRLLRGAGPRGLAGMQPLRRLGPGHLGRPLLGWTQAAIADYLARHELDWVEDPSNRDRGPDRNYLRLELLPRIERRWPGYRGALLRAADWQRSAAAALDERAAADLEALRQRAWHDSEDRLDLSGWLALEPERAFAVMRQWCLERAIEPPPTARLAEFRAQAAACADDARPCLDWPAARAHAWRDRLWLDPKPLPPATWNRVWPLAHDEVPVPAGGRLVWRGPERKRLGEHWSIGGLEPGERLSPGARRPRTKVTELLRLAGIPPWRRAWLPCLRIDGGLAAVGPELVDAGFAEVLARHGGRLEWRHRPVTLLPSRHDNSQE